MVYQFEGKLLVFVRLPPPHVFVILTGNAPVIRYHSKGPNTIPRDHFRLTDVPNL